jgi:CspA family cold shock protein
MSTRVRGKVKWFSDQRGFGFILDDSDDEEYFVHFSSINMNGFKTLKEGQDVEFKLVLTDKGIQAADVVAVD